MDFQTLLSFIKTENAHLAAFYGETLADQDKRKLAQMVKLTEEVGEVANEVLASQGTQRPEKLAKHSADNLPEELADVLIVTLLLADLYGLDVPRLLEEKMAKIKKRHATS